LPASQATATSPGWLIATSQAAGSVTGAVNAPPAGRVVTWPSPVASTRSPSALAPSRGGAVIGVVPNGSTAGAQPAACAVAGARAAAASAAPSRVLRTNFIASMVTGQRP
jgi:hypothetical protein